MNAPLAEMLRYNGWANERLLDACRSLSEEQLDARVAGTSGSVRELLVHIVGGQQTFVLRTKGRQHEGELHRGSAWPGFEALAAVLEASNGELIAVAEGLDEDVVVRLPDMGKDYVYPRSFFLVHAAGHGAEHRTEIKVALAQMGVATPDLDAWEWAAAMGYGGEG